MDIDVHALLQGYLKWLKSKGGRLVAGAEVMRLEREQGEWRAVTRAGAFRAPVLVNAGGAWADEIATIAGLAPLGLRPLRRTAVTVDLPPDGSPAHWPMAHDIDDEFYFKPEAGRLLASPADETPSPPCDAQADELDVALAIERLERATTIRVRQITHRWAGLRTFAPDRTTVLGYDSAGEGFFWVAGQGGYGIQTSAAMGRAAAALVAGEDLPADLRALGLSQSTLSPGRLSA
jgi:D-arginine dehydrogenase